MVNPTHRNALELTGLQLEIAAGYVPGAARWASNLVACPDQLRRRDPAEFLF